jgi:hypothetical protein
MNFSYLTDLVVYLALATFGVIVYIASSLRETRHVLSSRDGQWARH